MIISNNYRYSIFVVFTTAVISGCVNTAELEKNAISSNGFSPKEAGYMRSCTKVMDENNLQFKSGANRVDGCACIVTNNKRLQPQGYGIDVLMQGHELLMTSRSLSSTGGAVAKQALKTKYQITDEQASKVLNTNALAMLSCSRKTDDPTLNAKIDDVLEKEALKNQQTTTPSPSTGQNSNPSTGGASTQSPSTVNNVPPPIPKPSQ